ncbi:unnamed protein product [Diplocarpon coronariae]
MLDLWQRQRRTSYHRSQESRERVVCTENMRPSRPTTASPSPSPALAASRPIHGRQRTGSTLHSLHGIYSTLGNPMHFVQARRATKQPLRVLTGAILSSYRAWYGARCEMLYRADRRTSTGQTLATERKRNRKKTSETVLQRVGWLACHGFISETVAEVFSGRRSVEAAPRRDKSLEWVDP